MGQVVLRVRVEPALEGMVSGMAPVERRALARKFYRWSKQLWVSAEIIERDSGAPRRGGGGPLPRRRQALN